MKNYLHESTRAVLIDKTEQVLLAAHAALMQDQFYPLLERDKIEDLSRMFSLLSRVPDTLVKLRNIFEDHVREAGLVALRKIDEAGTEAAASGVATPEEEPKKKSSETDPKVYISVLLEVHSKFESVCTAAFKAEAGFVASLEKGCREFVNRNVICKGSSKSSELLAKYSDGLLRKSSKLNEDSETETLLNGVVILY